MGKDKAEGINITTFVLPTSLLKYGINENGKFRVEFQSFTSRRRNDLIKNSTLLLEPVEVGFKARLWEEKGALPKTSFILHTAIPKFSSRQYSHLSVSPNFHFVHYPLTLIPLLPALQSMINGEVTLKYSVL